MKQAVIINVVVGKGEERLRIEYEDNVLEFYLGEKKIFSCDYRGNFRKAVMKLEQFTQEEKLEEE